MHPHIGELPKFFCKLGTGIDRKKYFAGVNNGAKYHDGVYIMYSEGFTRIINCFGLFDTFCQTFWLRLISRCAAQHRHIFYLIVITLHKGRVKTCQLTCECEVYNAD